jgi:hypothetical protein
MISIACRTYGNYGQPKASDRARQMRELREPTNRSGAGARLLTVSASSERNHDVSRSYPRALAQIVQLGIAAHELAHSAVTDCRMRVDATLVSASDL